jgi:hypothetical protein
VLRTRPSCGNKAVYNKGGTERIELDINEKDEADVTPGGLT